MDYLSEEELEKIKIEGMTPDEVFIYENAKEVELVNNHIAQLLMKIELDKNIYLTKSNSFIFLKKHINLECDINAEDFVLLSKQGLKDIEFREYEKGILEGITLSKPKKQEVIKNQMPTCKACNGAGIILIDECDWCKGTGKETIK